MKKKTGKKRKWFIDLLLLIVIVAIGIFFYFRLHQMVQDRQDNEPASSSESAQNSSEVITAEPYLEKDQGEGDESPTPIPLAFGLVDINGEEIALSDFRGTPVMVNFWATWCPPCRSEMPLIQEFATEHQGEFIVLAINAGEQKDIVQDFVESQGYSNIIFLLDPENSVANFYRVPGFPTSLFVDEEGMLQGVHIGELDRSLIEQYLAEIGVEP
jgi:thiol-disulfide isomerase/thioredoxin